MKFLASAFCGAILALSGIAAAQVGGPMIGQASLNTAAVTGGTIDGAVIGGTTPAAGTFTTMTATGQMIAKTGSCAANGPGFAFAGSLNTGFYSSTADRIDVCIGTTATWRFSEGGNFIIAADNSFDIGASGATRPRTGYFGTSVVTPALTSSAATLPINGLAAAAGGSVTISGGAGSSTTGGTVALTGGTATSGAGSTITITAGAGAGGTNSGGDVNLIPGAAVSTGTPGEVKINSARGLFDTCWQQYLPASVPVTGTSYTFFMANRAYRVVAASIINSSASTVPTVDVTKDTGTTAPGAGTSVLTGVMTFSATANTRVSGTPSATVATTNLAAGDRLATKWAGTVGAITGAMVCVTLVPI